MTSIGVLDHPTARVEMEEPEDERVRGYRLNACRKEPWTTNWIENMVPGRCFLDVGACVGSYSLLAAKRGMMVIAVEPGFENYAALVRNAHRNKLEQAIVALRMALGPSNGLISVPSELTMGMSMVTGAPVPGRMEVVPQFTIDQILGLMRCQLPNYIKVDVDGNELGVLRGGRQVLSQLDCREVLVEAKRGTEAAIAEELAQCGLPLSQTFDKRNGQPIGDVVYLYFERKA